MSKDLSLMTKEELWQLFPIILVPHDPRWKRWYEEEAALLQAVIPGAALHHIGSTSVEGIWAKPIVDILALAEDDADLDALAQAICHAGYRCMSREENRISFNKGYTPKGFAQRVFHLHLRRRGDENELYFRDYLRAHPETAKAYEALKLRLWKPFEHDRDGYTEAKTDFITRYTEMAKAEKQQG